MPLQGQRGLAGKRASQLLLGKASQRTLKDKLGFRSAGRVGEGLTGMRTMPVWVALPKVGKAVELEG